jgi:Protein of unknown function (DUF3467)
MPPKQPTRGPTGQVVRIPDNVSEFYVNAMQVALTPWDVMLLFGSAALPEVFIGSSPFKTEIRVDAVIRMSPQHAKAVVRALSSVMDEYDKQFGEVHIPELEATDANPTIS